MKTAAITLLCLIAWVVSAQVPQAFKYQVVLRDASGEVLSNQSVGLRVSIHETNTGGPIIYQETFSVTSNQFGLVNLEIGNGTATLGDFETIDWGSDSKFFQTEIDPTGGTNYYTMGTSQLLSVPYSLYSERSKDSPWELSGNNLYYNNGFVGINKENPEVHLDVHGEICSYQPGTATGEIYLSGPLSSPGIVMFSNQPEHYRTNIIRVPEGLGFGVHAASTSPGYSSLFINNSGNIGIGTTTPTNRLELFSDSPKLYFNRGSSTTNVSGIYWRSTDDNFEGAFVRNNTSGDIELYTNITGGTPRLMVTDAGNVGIGTTSPETQLHIGTSTQFSPLDYSGQYKGSLHLSLSDGWQGYQLYGPGISFSGINTSRRRAAIASIQTSWDSDQFGLAFFTHPGTSTSNDQVVQMMVITHGGNVGIGIEEPESRLDVLGNVIIRDESTGDIAVELGTGLDYAEGFDVSENEITEPGTVMCLDPDNPGKLRICEKEYDTKVAGIVAGANYLGSGVTLGAGKHDLNVALAGRVFCQVDATESDIEIGDLLTTSELPGFAKKAMDPLKAQGAILGKAMQKLKKGEKGQILVLVTLQ